MVYQLVYLALVPQSQKGRVLCSSQQSGRSQSLNLGPPFFFLPAGLLVQAHATCRRFDSRSSRPFLCVSPHHCTHLLSVYCQKGTKELPQNIGKKELLYGNSIGIIIYFLFSFSWLGSTYWLLVWFVFIMYVILLNHIPILKKIVYCIE